MRFKQVFVVWQKEMMDSLRDRRSLIIGVFVPLLIMPLFVLGPIYLRLQEEKQNQTTLQEVVVRNAAAAPEFMAMLTEQSGLKPIELANPEKALEEGKIALILEIADGFTKEIAQEKSSKLTVKHNPTKSSSNTARAKLRELLTAYEKEIIVKRLETRQLPAELTEPVSVEYQSIASQEQLGGLALSFILPMFLIMWAAIGGAQAAIDVTVGEKERKTLEMLLVTPAGRSSLVLGKVLAIFTSATIATMMIMMGLLVSFKVGPQILGAQSDRLPGLAIRAEVLACLIAVSMSIAAMVSAWVFALFSWTRSLREAQGYTTWVSFGSIIPPMAVQFRDVPISLGILMVPFLNATLVYKELLLGKADLMHVGVTITSSLLYGVIGLIVATRVFNNERVLFRQ